MEIFAAPFVFNASTPVAQKMDVTTAKWDLVRGSIAVYTHECIRFGRSRFVLFLLFTDSLARHSSGEAR